MKKSTIVMVMITIVSLALSVVFGVIAVFMLLGATEKSLDEVDFGKYVSQIEEWIDDAGSSVNVEADGNKVNVSAGGVHVESDDGHTVDVGLNGIMVG
ncbi:hypothetical protein SAMN02910456_02500 [Ruminococcaceae bacterium YRB3002]|nr:hypothetical protein SAMN02910456_02500 [Ruminococcaceae bacterium YRB3002]